MNTTKEDLYKETKEALENRGVDINRLGILFIDLQKKHSPDITEAKAMEEIDAILHKREVQHAILTGIEIDVLAEQSQANTHLMDIIRRDESLYGVDETLAASIVNCYGSIAISNFGHLDITKPGIIGEFNDQKAKPEEVHTFLDDILCAIVAAACSRYAHNQ